MKHCVKHHHHITALVAALAIAVSGCSRADAPKGAQPYHLPTLTGRLDMTLPQDGGYKPPPQIDGKRLFDAVIRCYPAPSLFRGELAAIARAGMGQTIDPTDATLSGKTYLGLVAKIPLYSPLETDREREREDARRAKIATAVGNLIEAATAKAIATRKRQLYLSLESRAAMRVRYGVAETTEQVKYLEQLAAQEEAIAKAEAAIQAARLALRGMCRDDQAEALDQLINDMLEGHK